MADWATISSLATAGGTLVLAIATFSSVRSANRAARAAERSLLAGLRPVLIPSREDDPTERIMFGDGVWLSVPGHAGVIKVEGDGLYMAMAVRNSGAGLAIIQGWHATPGPGPNDYRPGALAELRPELDDFRRQSRDLYIPAGDSGFWQGAIRDTNDAWYGPLVDAKHNKGRIMVDLLYGDYEGGQRTIVRFSINPDEERGARDASVVRYWNIDGADPRHA
jgi:hypothetical protein